MTTRRIRRSMRHVVLLLLSSLCTRTSSTVAATTRTRTFSSLFTSPRINRSFGVRSRCRNQSVVWNIRGGGSAADDDKDNGSSGSSSSDDSTLSSTLQQQQQERTFPEDSLVEYKWLGDEILHDHWRRLIRRKVQVLFHQQQSDEKQQNQQQQQAVEPLILDFEIVGQRGTDHAVLIFVWHTQTQTMTFIREYMPALHGYQLGCAAGMVEYDKHQQQQQQQEDNNSNEKDHDLVEKAAWMAAAQAELEEECHLRQTDPTQWIQLCPPTVMDKYSTTRILAYLVLDPVTTTPTTTTLQRDEAEAGMQIITNVTIPELLSWITDTTNTCAKMTIVGGWASLLAIHKLRELKLL